MSEFKVMTSASLCIVFWALGLEALAAFWFLVGLRWLFGKGAAQ